MIAVESIGLIVSGILVFSTLFLRTFLTEVVKKHIASLGAAQTKLIFNFALVLGIAGLSLSLHLVFNNASPTTPDSNILIEEETETKSDIEEYIDLAIEVKDEIDKEVQKNRERNEQIKASKSERWSIQIGEILKNRRLLKTSYSQLYERDTSLIAFKNKGYKIIKDYSGKLSRQEIESKLQELELAFKGLNARLTIFDLNQECKARKNVYETNKIRFGKGRFIPIYECE
jgi:phage gpG-like protein